MNRISRGRLILSKAVYYANKTHAEFRNKNVSHGDNCSYYLTQAIALEKGTSIADRLIEKAITGVDGSITWIAPKYHPNLKKYQLEPISADIYNGNAGIAFFFAALYKLTGQEKYKNTVSGILKMSLEYIEETENLRLPLGGISGNGSYVYSFFKTGVLTDDLRMVEAAKKAAFQITKKSIQQHKYFDIIHGSAGTILSLVQLYEYCKDERLIDILNSCGSHLLNNRDLTSSGFRVWREDTFLTGLSHGAAGIAYALLKLYKLTNYTLYMEAALEKVRRCRGQ
jgi:lantibiotic modifying enzyme